MARRTLAAATSTELRLAQRVLARWRRWRLRLRRCAPDLLAATCDLAGALDAYLSFDERKR